MKRRELERKLRALGWCFVEHGGNHDHWESADGTAKNNVPRHPEVNEKLARDILRTAEAHPKKK